MKIQIDSERLKKLERAEMKLQALEQGGVDNWEFYSEALNEYSNTIELEENIEEVLTEIEVALLPSERGAGYCSTDEARDEAFNILKNFVDKLKSK